MNILYIYTYKRLREIHLAQRYTQNDGVLLSWQSVSKPKVSNPMHYLHSAWTNEMEIVKSMAKLVISWYWVHFGGPIIHVHSAFTTLLKWLLPWHLYPRLFCRLAGGPDTPGAARRKVRLISSDIQSRSNKIPNKNKIIPFDESSSASLPWFLGKANHGRNQNWWEKMLRSC